MRARATRWGGCRSGSRGRGPASSGARPCREGGGVHGQCGAEARPREGCQYGVCRCWSGHRVRWGCMAVQAR